MTTSESLLTREELEKLKALAEAATEYNVIAFEAFIAASREAVPRLIADLERARELLEEAHGVLGHKGARGPMMDEIGTYLKDAGL